MNRQDEGIKLLKDIKNISRLIEQLQEEIDKTYTMLTSTTVKPKEVNVQSSGSTDPMADKMIQILEYQEQIESYQLELCAKKSIAIQTMRSMEYKNQELLILRYLKGNTIEQVAEILGRGSYYRTWEALHKAEEEFCEIYSTTG